MKVYNLLLTIGLFLVVATLPLANQDLFAFWHPKLFPSRLILIALIGLSLGSYFINLANRDSFKKGLDKLKQDRLFILLVALWMVRAISLTQSWNLGASLSLLAFYTAAIAFYLLLKYYDQVNPHHLFRLYSLHVLVAVGVAFFALFQLGQAILGTRLPGVLLGGNYIRVPGTFYDANHLPAYLMTVLPFCLAASWGAPKAWQRLGSFGLVVLLSLVILSTFSRSGMLALAVGMTIMAVGAYLLGWWRKVLMFGSLFLMGVIVLALTSQTEYSLVKRLASVADPAEKSTTAHKILMAGEWALFLDNPVIGVGYGSFSEHFRASYWGAEHAKVDPATSVRLPTHSLWLETMVETGALGFGLYLGLIVLVVWSLGAALIRSKCKKEQMFFLALLGSVGGVMSGGLFYSYNLEFLWFLLFLSYLVSQRLSPPWPEGVGEGVEQVEGRELGACLFLTVVSGALLFWRLGGTTLIDWDEAIYAGVAKNMLLGKDFLAPYWNGHHWFEKPPLYMWLTVPLLYFYKITSFAARFWGAAFGVVGVLATYWLGRTLYSSRKVGFLSGLVLVTNVAYLQYGRMAMLDVPLAALTTVTLLFFVKGERSLNGWFFGLAGAAAGLAVMTKGAVGLLAVVILAGYTLWRMFSLRSWRRWIKFWLVFLFGLLFVALPWHIYMYHRFGPEFWNQYFIYHVLKRGTEAIEGKAAGTWVYIAVIRHGMRIWYGPLLPALPWLVWQFKKGRSEAALLMIWVLVIFGFFTLARSKLMWYIVPIYPALSLVVGAFAASLLDQLKPLAAALEEVQPLKTLKRLPKWILGVEPLIIVFMAVLSLAYVGKKWGLVAPPDFNQDLVTLIDRKNNISPQAAQTILLLPGIASPVPLYYSNGPVLEIPKEELKSRFHQPDHYFTLMSYTEYQHWRQELRSEGISLRLAGATTSEGDLVLVEKLERGK